ncbi:MAG: hypothetical protein WKF75_14490 [Singulisphaera sp.]
MKCFWIAHTCAVIFTLAGCGPATMEPPPRALPSPATQSPPPRVALPPASDGVDDRGTSGVEVSGETDRDRRFGEFVKKTAGGMLKAVAVGIERGNELRVELGEATAPEDTLPLTKGLLSGARKDFPGQPITVSVYDPTDEPILKALYEPEEGVRYEVAQSKDSPRRKSSSTRPGGDASTATRSAPRGGLSDKDRQFADWAMNKGGDYLRYVEADLERKGRLWFGITRRSSPKTSGPDQIAARRARTEFPRRELTATVFDPEGNGSAMRPSAATGTSSGSDDDDHVSRASSRQTLFVRGDDHAEMGLAGLQECRLRATEPGER